METKQQHMESVFSGPADFYTAYNKIGGFYLLNDELFNKAVYEIVKRAYTEEDCKECNVLVFEKEKTGTVIAVRESYFKNVHIGG